MAAEMSRQLVQLLPWKSSVPTRAARQADHPLPQDPRPGCWPRTQSVQAAGSCSRPGASAGRGRQHYPPPSALVGATIASLGGGYRSSLFVCCLPALLLMAPWPALMSIFPYEHSLGALISPWPNPGLASQCVPFPSTPPPPRSMIWTGWSRYWQVTLVKPVMLLGPARKSGQQSGKVIRVGF